MQNAQGEKPYSSIDGAPVELLGVTRVKEGVDCDIYIFTGDSSRDLGIVSVEAGFATPRQRVLLGKKTIEGYLSGKGSLVVKSQTGETREYRYPDSGLPQTVNIERGQTMQWHADAGSDLTFYEICEPPYKDGRFENLPD